jgi:replicative DNA helicase
MIMLLYRNEYYEQGGGDDVVEVNVAKHRNGQPAICNLLFNGSYSLFYEGE